ncbi:cell division protein FtsA [Bartonella sp. DGB2]|uniref:cell division protein FtsA n=1 Tax=Bartonella sp. DGB2 TaxID=3388426 RepID=UPI00398FB002
MRLFRGKGNLARKPGLLTVLDVGSSKVTCVIARLRPSNKAYYLANRTHRVDVLGFGVQQSRGIKAGTIVDMDAAEQTIRLVVDAAEKMSGLVVDSLIVNFSSARMSSALIKAEINLDGRPVTPYEIKRVLAAASHKAFSFERHILHSLPLCYTLDGEGGIADPLGMMGEVLGVDVHVVHTDTVPLRNLEMCINRAHLTAAAVVATPFASGLAVLLEDEARLGAACIDLGGGITSFSVFHDGKFVHGDALSIGANHITLDIARGFSIAPQEAERLKVMHGAAFPADMDNHDMVRLEPLSGEYFDSQYPRTALNRMVLARVEEILEMVRDQLNSSGFGHIVGKRLVLTGGGSQLTGIAEAARRILGRHVRIGRPLGVSGLPSLAKGAAFSTVVGLLIYPQSAGFEEQVVQAALAQLPQRASGPLQRVGQWLRESF